MPIIQFKFPTRDCRGCFCFPTAKYTFNEVNLCKFIAATQKMHRKPRQNIIFHVQNKVKSFIVSGIADLLFNSKPEPEFVLNVYRVLVGIWRQGIFEKQGVQNFNLQYLVSFPCGLLHDIYRKKVVSLYGASPYCLFPGYIVTWV